MIFLIFSCSPHNIELCPDPLGLEMIKIEKGSFQMGATAGEVDTYPIHKVELTTGFCLLSTEVTQEMLSFSTIENSSPYKSPLLPVSNITWFEAISVANELSVKSNLSPCYEIPPYLTDHQVEISQINHEVKWNRECNGYRLPTEAEWEYAAKSNEKWNYSGGYNFDKYAVYKENSQQKPANMKSMKPNSWGLYDMSGNVSEWVWDGYGMYSEHFVQDPTGSKNPKIRVSRGGGFSDPPELIRVDVRSADGPEWRFDWVGFRLARNLN